MDGCSEPWQQVQNDCVITSPWQQLSVDSTSWPLAGGCCIHVQEQYLTIPAGGVRAVRILSLRDKTQMCVCLACKSMLSMTEAQPAVQEAPLPDKTAKGAHPLMCVQRPFRSEAPLLLDIFSDIFKGADAGQLAAACLPKLPASAQENVAPEAGRGGQRQPVRPRPKGGGTRTPGADVKGSTCISSCASMAGSKGPEPAAKQRLHFQRLHFKFKLCQQDSLYVGCMHEQQEHIWPLHYSDDHC